MFKVVIIDDEILARVGIKSMINWEDIGCEVAGDAENGETGLELIRKSLPDIVITDIKMPVMDGLNLIEKTKKEFSNVKFIVLSSYDEFQLVKQAMKLGAEEYLIKLDLEPEVLSKTVTAVIEKINSELEKKTEQDSLNQHFKINKQVLVEEFLKKLIGRMILSQKDINDGIRHLDINLKQERLACAVVSVGDIQNNERFRSKEDKEVFDFYVLNITQEIANDYFGSYIVRMEPDKFAIVFSVEEPMDRMIYKEETGKMGTRIIEMLHQYVGIDVTVGMSNIHSGYLNLNKAYNEAEEASRQSFFTGYGKVSFFAELFREAKKPSIDIYQFKNDLINGIELNDIEKIIHVLDSITEIFRQGRIEKGQAYDLCFQTAAAVYETAGFGRSSAGNKEMPADSLYENVTKNSTLPEMIIWINNLRRDFCDYLTKRDSLDHNERLVRAAKKYINDNYDKNLNLNDVAAALNVSHCYFSTVFKSVAGINFIDYVTNVKISHAKTLLLDGNHKIYEVAEMLGYENAYYFSRVFKKVTSLTPSEFIEKKY